MTKKSKILLSLLILLLLIILYIILTSESVKNSGVITLSKEEISQQIEDNYKPQAKKIFNEYEELAQRDNLTLESVKLLKEKLLVLKVPSKFKELHITFVMALVKLENYLMQNNIEEKKTSLQMANQLKADYSWLNN